MKNYMLLIIIALTGCTKQETSFTISCNARKDYAKTVTEAQSKLVVSWRLVSDQGFTTSNGIRPVANVIVSFSSAQKVAATINGKQTNEVSYQVVIAPSPYSGGTAYTQLSLVNAIVAPNTTAYSLRNGVIFVCDNQLVIDYGSAVDLPVQEYSRIE